MTEEPRLDSGADAALYGASPKPVPPRLELVPVPVDEGNDEIDPEARAEPDRLLDPGIECFTVEAEGRKWGAFATANDAARWAMIGLPAMFSLPLRCIDWIIRPVLKAGSLDVSQ